MSLSSLSPLLRRTLIADAAISGTTGLLMIAFANTLSELLGVPVALMRYAGVSLLPFAALLVYLARRESLSRAVVWVVIACNALWAVDSILIMLIGWVEPTVLGQAFIIAQALIVALFAEVQYLGLRRSAATVA